MKFRSLFNQDYLSDYQKKISSRVLKKAEKYKCNSKTNNVVLSAFLNKSTNNNLLKLLGKINYNEFFNEFEVTSDLIIGFLKTKPNNSLTIKELKRIKFFNFFNISIDRFKRICVSSGNIETAFTAGLDWVRLY